MDIETKEKLKEVKRRTDWYAHVFGPKRLGDLNVVVHLDVEAYERLLVAWESRDKLQHDSIRFIQSWNHSSGDEFSIYVHRAVYDEDVFDIMLCPDRDDWSAKEKEYWLALNN